MMIHKHTMHRDGFTVLMHSGVKSWCFDVVMRIETLDVYIMSICMLISLCAWVICLVRMCANFSLVYICVVFVNPFLLFYLCFFLLLPSYFFFFKDFVGMSSANPHETSLVHLGEPRGLKGLLRTLNTTVIPTKVS